MSGKYEEKTIPAIFFNLVEKKHEAVFLKYHDGEGWRDLTWDQVKERVDCLASYLIKNGINTGDRLAIYSYNRPEWLISDLACLSVGAADVTIYSTNSAQEAAYIINDSGCRYCFCGGEFQLNNLLAAIDEMPTLEKIIVFDEIECSDQRVETLSQVLAAGAKNLQLEEIDRRLRAIDPEDIMTIIYTSGTTGDPKGAMLSHNNMVTQLMQFTKAESLPVPFTPLAISILPLSHALERTVGYHGYMYAGGVGGTIIFSRGPDFLLEDLQATRPTLSIMVPRIPEKLYDGIMNMVTTLPPGKQKLFQWALKCGREAAPYLMNNQKPPFMVNLKYRLAYKLVLSKVREAIGMDQFRCSGVGGGPLASHLVEFFISLGVELHLGYGLTETAPITHVTPWTYVGPIKPRSSGPIVEHTEIKIAEDGEILIKGPQVFKGYYNKPEATREVFTEDGWFKTGDIGEVDADTYLIITDRKKDIIITAGGKNVAPQQIESRFISSPFIEQIAVIGEGRKYISALIVPDFEQVSTWASQNGISGDIETILNSKEAQEFFNQIIDELNQPLSQPEKIKKFVLLPKAFTQEDGELTPTLKVKRKVVSEKYADLIDSLYQE